MEMIGVSRMNSSDISSSLKYAKACMSSAYIKIVETNTATFNQILGTEESLGRKFQPRQCISRVQDILHCTAWWIDS